MKKNLINIIIMLLIIYDTLFVFDYFASPYRKLPRDGFSGKQHYTWGHLVKYNKYWFRDKNFSETKENELFRVMVLGDSITWGVGLKIEERYTSIAEKLLNDLPDGKKYEILNFGVMGISTAAQRDILKKYKDIVKPDLIVIGFCLNDTQSKREDYSKEREEFENKILSKIIVFAAHGLRAIALDYVATLVYKAYFNTAMRAGKFPDRLTALDRTYEKDSNDWKEFVRALDDIKKISVDLRLPPPHFMILNQGTYFNKPDVYTDSEDKFIKRYLKWYHQVEKIARNKGFVTYNVEKELKTEKLSESLCINKLDAHPSAFLNKIYGKKLFEKIIKLNNE